MPGPADGISTQCQRAMGPDERTRWPKALAPQSADKIAKALNVNRWVLLNNEALPPSPLELTERETNLIIKYRSLPEAEEKMVDFAVDSINRMYRHYRVIPQDLIDTGNDKPE